VKRVSKGIQYDDKYDYETFTKEALIKRYKLSDWSYNNNLEIEKVVLKNDKENIIFTEDLEVSIRDFATINTSELLLTVNVFNRQSAIPKRYRNRKLPLKIGRGYKDVDAFTITIPENYRITFLPETKALKTKYGTYKIVFTKVDERTFKYNRTIVIKEGTYPKEDYKLYRTFRKKIVRYDNTRIAFTQK
jgi:hypothetical protein